LGAAQRRKIKKQNNKQRVFLQEVEQQKKEARQVLKEMEEKIQELKSIDKLSNKQKGNYGEAKMHLHYLEQGYKRISLNKVKELDDPIHHGIDGIYYNPNKNPKYIIVEAKFGTSKLDGKTKQMSDDWLTDNKLKRLKDDVGEEHAKEIEKLLKENSNEARKDLFHIDKKGNVSIKELDENAKTKNLIKRIENAKRY
ncbi:hypothetical protein ACRCD5_07810, partial [Campylobacter taeniopygiae]